MRPIVVRPWWLGLAAFDFFMAGYWFVRESWTVPFYVALGIYMFWPTSSAADDYAVRIGHDRCQEPTP